MRIHRGLRRAAPLLLVLLLAALVAACSEPQTTMEPKSDNADTIQGVYVFIFWLAAIVFVGVLALILFLAIAYRERPGREARQIHGNTRLELIWTAIPVILVVVMAVPTWQAIADTSGDAPDDALVVTAVGRQWWFEFRYQGLGPDGGDLVTANELHLPVDRPVSVLLQSEDVIHSFWVPQLAGKVDMVPGHENDLWFTPNEARAEPFLGQCAEFCGTSHANMRFRVFVDSQADFDAWVAREQSDGAEPTSELAMQGKEIFLQSACIGCHTVQGTEAIAAVGPNLTHIGSRSTIAAGIMENTQENLVAWISNPAREKPGMSPENDGRFMPAFENTLTREQIEAIAAYLLELE